MPSFPDLLHAFLSDQLSGSDSEGHIDSDEDEDLLEGIYLLSQSIIQPSPPFMLPVIPLVSAACAMSGFGPPLPGGVQVLAAIVCFVVEKAK